MIDELLTRPRVKPKTKKNLFLKQVLSKKSYYFLKKEEGPP